MPSWLYDGSPALQWGCRIDTFVNSTAPSLNPRWNMVSLSGTNLSAPMPPGNVNVDRLESPASWEKCNNSPLDRSLVVSTPHPQTYSTTMLDSHQLSFTSTRLLPTLLLTSPPFLPLIHCTSPSYAVSHAPQTPLRSPP